MTFLDRMTWAWLLRQIRVPLVVAAAFLIAAPLSGHARWCLLNAGAWLAVAAVVAAAWYHHRLQFTMMIEAHLALEARCRKQHETELEERRCPACSSI